MDLYSIVYHLDLLPHPNFLTLDRHDCEMQSPHIVGTEQTIYNETLHIIHAMNVLERFFADQVICYGLRFC